MRESRRAADANVHVADYMKEQYDADKAERAEEVRWRQWALLQSLKRECGFIRHGYENGTIALMRLPTWEQSRFEVTLWFPALALPLNAVDLNAQSLNTTVERLFTISTSAEEINAGKKVIIEQMKGILSTVTHAMEEIDRVAVEWQRRSRPVKTVEGSPP